MTEHKTGKFDQTHTAAQHGSCLYFSRLVPCYHFTGKSLALEIDVTEAETFLVEKKGKTRSLGMKRLNEDTDQLHEIYQVPQQDTVLLTAFNSGTVIEVKGLRTLDLKHLSGTSDSL